MLLPWSVQLNESLAFSVQMIVETFDVVASYTLVKTRMAMKLHPVRSRPNPAFKRFQILPEWPVRVVIEAAFPAPRFVDPAVAATHSSVALIVNRAPQSAQAIAE